jgi:hypothetical protein
MKITVKAESFYKKLKGNLCSMENFIFFNGDIDRKEA